MKKSNQTRKTRVTSQNRVAAGKSRKHNQKREGFSSIKEIFTPRRGKKLKTNRYMLQTSVIVVALFLGLILVSCSDDDDQGGVIDTGIHKIVVEQSGDIDAFELGLVFGAVNTISGPTKLYDEDGKYLGESHSVTRMEDAKVSCQTGDDAFFMTCAGSVTSTSDVSGKKLKVLVTAYIDGKEVNQLVKEYETKGEILIENFSVSTTAK